MNSNNIRETIGQIGILKSQANELEQNDGPQEAVNAINRAIAQLERNIAPYCYGCGETLTPIDYGDHLCNGCIGNLPISYPD